MSDSIWLRRTQRWVTLLLRLYPRDFRDEMGEGLVEAYRDRASAALWSQGPGAVVWLWLRALLDSLWNGIAERIRPAVRWRRSGQWGRDTELVLRRLARAPLFASSVVGTLAVGLGAFAVVFAAVDMVLLAPLPYEEPEDLYFVWREYSWLELERGWLGGPDIAELQKVGGPIQAAVGLQRNLLTFAATYMAEPDEIPVLYATANLFDVLGVEPMLGRGFLPGDEGPEGDRVMVLGNDLWRARFGADPDVVGSQVNLGIATFTVIGVMPPSFRFRSHSSLGPPQEAAAYATFPYHLAEQNPGAGSFAGMIRARPGSSSEAVASAVAAVGTMVDERSFSSMGLHLYPVEMKEDLVARVRPALTVLGLAGALLVLVLMVNLANLLLVRAAQRQREFAISRALGSNRVALLRAMLLEGAVLGALGGAVAALLATWGTRLLVALAPADLPRRESIAIGWRIAAVVVLVGALVGLAAATLPAVWATRTRLTALLASASVRGGGGATGKARRAMVVMQVALSLVLLCAGALVVRSFGELLRTHPGFRPEGVLTFRVPVGTAGYPEMADALALQTRLRRELGEIPGVHAVGATSSLPLSAVTNQSAISFAGAPGNTGDPDRDAPLTDWIRVTPGYLEAMGIRILAGRSFEEGSGGEREIVIDQTLADYHFPGADPLGYRLTLEGVEHTVVGVAEHARLYHVHEDGRPHYYVNVASNPQRTLYWTLRTDRDLASVATEVRNAVRRIDPALAISQVRSMNDLVSEAVSQQRLSAVLIGGFALGALLLAAMGLFGVVAGSVNRRRHELAVRLALGAEYRRVIWLVLREGAFLVVLGLLVGAPGIYFAGRALGGVLVGVSPFDPLTLVAVSAGLGLVSLVACYFPARRVTTIDPAGYLRQD